MGEGGGGSAAAAPQPGQAGTTAEFVAALRALRTWSGLTYRQLEGKATANKDVLPASTIATTLGRAGLPRERFGDAFTRACGLGEDDVLQWIEVRRRLALDQSAPDQTAPNQAEADPGRDEREKAGPPRWRRVVGLVAAAVGSWARVHPARTPDLCVTEGVDRTGPAGTGPRSPPNVPAKARPCHACSSNRWATTSCRSSGTTRSTASGA